MIKKVALITGGSRGIGFGIAKQLATKGFDLAINDIRADAEVTAAIQELSSMGSEVLFCQGDVSSTEDRQQMLGKIKAHFGKLHVLVNNAGVAPKERKDLLETTEESFEFVMKTNLYGAFFLTQAVANWMIEQKSTDPDFEGCIINISSISATVASINRGEYCISKAGLSMVTKLFAARLGEHNIPVYEIRPGIIKTHMTAVVADKYDKLISEGLTVQKRWGYPEDIGKAVAVLVDGALPYSTGEVILVDGGLTLPRL